MRTFSPRWCLIGTLVLACGDSDDGGDNATSFGPTSSSTTASSSPTTSESSATSSTSSGSGGSTAAQTTDTSTSGEIGSTGATDSSGSSGVTSTGSDTAGSCQPPPPDNACLECVVVDCCGVWAQCQADEACACVIDCHVVQGNSIGSCTNQCNSDGELYQGVYFCGQMYCLGICDWDNP